MIHNHFMREIENIIVFVKLQSKLNSSVKVGQGVDFVFPLTQEQQQEEQEEPLSKSTRTKCTTDMKFGTKI